MSKFKVGDWLRHFAGDIVQVVGVNVIDEDTTYILPNEKNYRVVIYYDPNPHFTGYDQTYDAQQSHVDKHFTLIEDKEREVLELLYGE